MATEFHEVLGQSITGPADLNALLLSAKDKDERHDATPPGLGGKRSFAPL